MFIGVVNDQNILKLVIQLLICNLLLPLSEAPLTKRKKAERLHIFVGNKKKILRVILK